MIGVEAGFAETVVLDLIHDQQKRGEQGKVSMDMTEHWVFKIRLQKHGFLRNNRLKRMFRPGKRRPILSGPNVFASSGMGLF
jgi:hypothetical protein